MPQEVTLSNSFYLFFFLQTVGFDSPVQLSKGTWTAEDSEKEYFAEKQAEIAILWAVLLQNIPCLNTLQFKYLYLIES